MPLVGGNVEENTWQQVDRLLLFKSESGRPRQKQHPLLRLLIVPEALGRSVPEGDDSLDADNGSVEKRLNEFLRKVCRDFGKQICKMIHRQNPV